MSGWAQSLETYSTSKLDTVGGTLSRVVGAPSRLSCLLWWRYLLQRKVRWRLGEKMRRCQRSNGGRVAAPTGGGSGGVEKVQGRDEVRYLTRFEPVIHGGCSSYRRSIDGRLGRSKRPL